mmetsp:Transcript_25526/g.64335  ORF Transcript_25526/g.64335 Transcript_25526/m.64335 type:complete len:362 (+) Transcript_25526:240-1325(+)
MLPQTNALVVVVDVPLQRVVLALLADVDQPRAEGVGLHELLVLGAHSKHHLPDTTLPLLHQQHVFVRDGRLVSSFDHAPSPGFPTPVHHLNLRYEHSVLPQLLLLLRLVEEELVRLALEHLQVSFPLLLYHTLAPRHEVAIQKVLLAPPRRERLGRVQAVVVGFLQNLDLVVRELHLRLQHLHFHLARLLRDHLQQRVSVPVQQLLHHCFPPHRHPENRVVRAHFLELPHLVAQVALHALPQRVVAPVPHRHHQLLLPLLRVPLLVQMLDHRVLLLLVLGLALPHGEALRGADEEVHGSAHFGQHHLHAIAVKVVQLLPDPRTVDLRGPLLENLVLLVVALSFLQVPHPVRGQVCRVLGRA